MGDWVSITDEPLSVDAALSQVRDPSAGAVVFFCGTTRNDPSADGSEIVAALDYEAYQPMAERQMLSLIQKARAQFSELRRVAVVHRKGTVPVGDMSVLVAVSAKHRAQAFDAARFLIDELKKSVPIWKKDIYAV